MGNVTVGLTGTYTEDILNYYEVWTETSSGSYIYDVSHPTKEINAYWVFGLRVATSWDGGEAFLRIDNAFDRQYARQIGSTLEDRNFPMPGRSLTLGTKLQF
jgi:outer membrane receptor for Fe3+-dicitrate